MNVLLLRLSGPMQAWGVQSRYGIRDSGLEPSKSGVAGLLCAALGRPRAEAVDDLAGLRMGVRVDREGVLRKDFHTASNILKAGGGIKETEVSTRYYLADACFLVGLESEDLALLQRLELALREPCWPLFLGRKSLVPGAPPWLPGGLRTDITLEQALAKAEPLCELARDARQLRLVLEDVAGSRIVRDQPISFVDGARQFGLRRLRIDYLPAPVAAGEGS